MLSTDQVYDVVVHRLAQIERQLKAYQGQYVGLPDNVFGFQNKPNVVREVENLVTGGDNQRKQRLIEATPFFHLNSGLNSNQAYPSTSYIAEAMKPTDVRVAQDVAKAGLTKEKIYTPYLTFPHSSRPLRGYESARRDLHGSITEAVEEREVLQNLARVLKVATSPELAPYKEKPAARIDRIAIDQDMVDHKTWPKITEVALKALLPRPIDEHVIDYYHHDQYDKPGQQSYQHSTGKALVVFGDSVYGQSDIPVYGIWTHHNYSRELDLSPSRDAAESLYRKETTPRKKYKTKWGADAHTEVRHERAGNFVGGAIASNEHHPGSAIRSQQVPHAVEPYQPLGDITIGTFVSHRRPTETLPIVNVLFRQQLTAT